MSDSAASYDTYQCEYVNEGWKRKCGKLHIFRCCSCGEHRIHHDRRVLFCNPIVKNVIYCDDMKPNVIVTFEQSCPNLYLHVLILGVEVLILGIDNFVADRKYVFKSGDDQSKWD